MNDVYTITNIIKINLPKGFMNTAVTLDNHFISDTNDGSNWHKLKLPLPTGKWSIYKTVRNVDKNVVILINKH